MQQIRNAGALAPTQQRDLNVSTKADSGIGLTDLREVTGKRALRLVDAPQRGQRRPGTGAIEARDRDGHKIESGLGNQTTLEFARLAHEHNVMTAVTQLLGQGERGVDMSCRAASCNSNGHLIGHGNPFVHAAPGHRCANAPTGPNSNRFDYIRRPHCDE